MRTCLLILLFLSAGCSQKQEAAAPAAAPADPRTQHYADNATTRYAIGLKTDTEKAKAAAEKANAAIAAEGQRMNTAQEQVE